jgi:hypothetical protein
MILGSRAGNWVTRIGRRSPGTDTGTFGHGWTSQRGTTKVTGRLDETRQDQTKQGQAMTRPKQEEQKSSPSEVTTLVVEIAKCCRLRY